MACQFHRRFMLFGRPWTARRRVAGRLALAGGHPGGLIQDAGKGMIPAIARRSRESMPDLYYHFLKRIYPIYRRLVRRPVARLFFMDLIGHTSNFANVTWLGHPVWQNVLDL